MRQQVIVEGHGQTEDSHLIPFTASASPDEVIGFLKALNDIKLPAIQYSDFQRMFALTTVSSFISIAIASEELRLLYRTINGLVLTDLGVRLLKASEGERKEILRRCLLSTEPFNTTLELMSTINDVTSDKVSRELMRSYPNLAPCFSDSSLIQKVLLEWGVYSELFDYNPGTRSFTHISH